MQQKTLDLLNQYARDPVWDEPTPKPDDWYDDRPAPQPRGLSKVEARQASLDFFNEFGCPLPEEYLEFLQHMNGFYFGDLHIYSRHNDEIAEHFPFHTGTDAMFDIVNINDENEFSDEFIELGESSLFLIAYDRASKKYFICDRGSLDHREECDTFDELVELFIDYV